MNESRTVSSISHDYNVKWGVVASDIRPKFERRIAPKYGTVVGVNMFQSDNLLKPYSQKQQRSSKSDGKANDAPVPPSESPSGVPSECAIL